MKYIVGIFLVMFSLSGMASIPSFLQKTKNGYVEKPVILVIEKKDTKFIVVAAYFPDNVCMKDPDSMVLNLPHKFVLAPNNTWQPCTPF
jgi:hypothetical protein